MQDLRETLPLFARGYHGEADSSAASNCLRLLEPGWQRCRPCGDGLQPVVQRAAVRCAAIVFGPGGRCCSAASAFGVPDTVRPDPPASEQLKYAVVSGVPGSNGLTVKDDRCNSQLIYPQFSQFCNFCSHFRSAGSWTLPGGHGTDTPRESCAGRPSPRQTSLSIEHAIRFRAPMAALAAW